MLASVAFGTLAQQWAGWFIVGGLVHSEWLLYDQQQLL